MALFSRCTNALGFAVISAALIGCSAPHDARPSASAPAEPQSQSPLRVTAASRRVPEATPTPTPPNQEDAPAEVQTATAPQADAAPAKIADFQAPFPDRVDLFVPPKREGGAATSGQGANDGAVELLGFVRVDRQRAVLSINGEINSLAEGDTQFGIQVISVHPPNVVLQRGRQRWQATLE